MPTGQPTGRPNRHRVWGPGVTRYDPRKPAYREKGVGRTEAEAMRQIAGQHVPYRTTWRQGILMMCDGVDTLMDHYQDPETGTHMITEHRPGFWESLWNALTA